MGHVPASRRSIRFTGAFKLRQEVMMKRLLAIAALLLASSAAQAQYSFEYGGRTIRIDPDRGTISIPGIYDNTGRRAKRARSNQDSGRSKSQPQEAKSDPQASPAPTDTTPAPAAPPPPANTATASPEPSTATANIAPADTAILPPPPPPPPSASPLVVLKESVPAPTPDAPRPEPSPSLAAVPPSAPAPAPVQRPQTAATAAVRDANSPVGVWLTEEKEGKVRIEQCGANLCGYSVDAKSNLNGEKVLINMYPSKDQKWSGRILDPNTGSTYDSTIALQGDVLRVQGCAFGGMFCGGQTWTRVN
jgi:uncharacterized protein (DUF2147 family)